MARNITIKLGSKSYSITAETTDEEQLIRRAADEVNGRIKAYMKANPGIPMDDLVSFAALNICRSYIRLSDDTRINEMEAGKLARELDGYLKEIDKDSR